MPSTARETVPAPLLVPALPTVLLFDCPPIAGTNVTSESGCVILLLPSHLHQFELDSFSSDAPSLWLTAPWPHPSLACAIAPGHLECIEGQPANSRRPFQTASSRHGSTLPALLGDQWITPFLATANRSAIHLFGCPLIAVPGQPIRIRMRSTWPSCHSSRSRAASCDARHVKSDSGCTLLRPSCQ